MRSLFLSVTTTLLLAAPTASAVEFYTVGPNSVTAAPGEQFTIELIVRNIVQSVPAISGLAASVHGYEGVASFESGQAIFGYLHATCLGAPGPILPNLCLDGLVNDAAGALVEDSTNPSGPRVQIALSPFDPTRQISHTGEGDIGLDLFTGTAQFRLTFTAQGEGQIRIGSYPGDGVFLPDGSTVQLPFELSFTVNAPPPPLTTFEIFDDTFAPEDWTTTTMAVTGGATEQVESRSTGGNPDDYRRTELFIPGVASIEVFNGFTGALFFPAAYGAIEFMSYSEDRIEFDPPFSGAAVGALPALVQDGIIYRGPFSNFTHTNWQTLSLTNLTALDFDDGTGGHPDLSENGGPIQFGYIRRNSSQNVSSSNTIASGIDNWSVTVFYPEVPVTATISDETFDAADWFATVTDATGGATQGAAFVAAGGNPGSYRETTHLVPGVASIEVFHAFEATTFTPDVEGELLEVDYSADRIELDPPFSGAAVGAAPALLQDGVVYVGPSATYTDTSWTSLDMPALVAEDFDDGTGGHPDFSASGSEIYFGYLRANSSQNASSTFTITAGIDNWSYELRYLPEPATPLGVGWAGTLIALLFRRRLQRVPDAPS